jgi:hypothetical protein
MCSALAKLEQWEKAYEELSVLIAICDPLYDAYKLRAYVGFVKLKPPKYEQCLLDLFHLLTIFPEDLDLVILLLLFIFTFTWKFQYRFCKELVFMLGCKIGTML